MTDQTLDALNEALASAGVTVLAEAWRRPKVLSALLAHHVGETWITMGQSPWPEGA